MPAPPETLEPLSRALSAVLRHRALEKKIPMYTNGFAPFLQVLRTLPSKGLDFSDVMTVVKTSCHTDGVPRFEVDHVAEPMLIRSTRNHTIPGIDLSAPHGTLLNSPSIARRRKLGVGCGRTAAVATGPSMVPSSAIVVDEPSVLPMSPEPPLRLATKEPPPQFHHDVGAGMPYKAPPRSYKPPPPHQVASTIGVCLAPAEKAASGVTAKPPPQDSHAPLPSAGSKAPVPAFKPPPATMRRDPPPVPPRRMGDPPPVPPRRSTTPPLRSLPTPSGQPAALGPSAPTMDADAIAATARDIIDDAATVFSDAGTVVLEAATQVPKAATPVSEGSWGVALHDFDASGYEGEDVLSLKRGDRLLWLKDIGGWSYGEAHGRKGFFPPKFWEASPPACNSEAMEPGGETQEIAQAEVSSHVAAEQQAQAAEEEVLEENVKEEQQEENQMEVDVANEDEAAAFAASVATIYGQQPFPASQQPAQPLDSHEASFGSRLMAPSPFEVAPCQSHAEAMRKEIGVQTQELPSADTAVASQSGDANEAGYHTEVAAAAQAEAHEQANAQARKHRRDAEVEAARRDDAEAEATRQRGAQQAHGQAYAMARQRQHAELEAASAEAEAKRQQVAHQVASALRTDAKQPTRPPEFQQVLRRQLETALAAATNEAAKAKAALQRAAYEHHVQLQENGQQHQRQLMQLQEQNVLHRRQLEKQLQAKPGDWNCPGCSDLQFARNSRCRRCGTLRPPFNTNDVEADEAHVPREYPPPRCQPALAPAATVEPQQLQWKRPPQDRPPSSALAPPAQMPVSAAAPKPKPKPPPPPIPTAPTSGEGPKPKPPSPPAPSQPLEAINEEAVTAPAINTTSATQQPHRSPCVANATSDPQQLQRKQPVQVQGQPPPSVAPRPSGAGPKAKPPPLDSPQLKPPPTKPKETSPQPKQSPAQLPPPKQTPPETKHPPVQQPTSKGPPVKQPPTQQDLPVKRPPPQAEPPPTAREDLPVKRPPPQAEPPPTAREDADFAASGDQELHPQLPQDLLLQKIFRENDGPRIFDGEPRNLADAEELTVCVDDVRFTHDKISKTFAHGPQAGQMVTDLIASLRDGDVHPLRTPSLVLTVARFSGALWSLNNRRLFALKEYASNMSDPVMIKVRAFTLCPITAKFLMSFSTDCEGTSVEFFRSGGVGRSLRPRQGGMPNFMGQEGRLAGVAGASRGVGNDFFDSSENCDSEDSDEDVVLRRKPRAVCEDVGVQTDADGPKETMDNNDTLGDEASQLSTQEEAEVRRWARGPNMTTSGLGVASGAAAWADEGIEGDSGEEQEQEAPELLTCQEEFPFCEFPDFQRLLETIGRGTRNHEESRETFHRLHKGMTLIRRSDKLRYIDALPGKMDVLQWLFDFAENRKLFKRRVVEVLDWLRVSRNFDACLSDPELRQRQRKLQGLGRPRDQKVRRAARPIPSRGQSSG
eukprot:TRINITY_DN22196_c0_g1_i1.p1 TRINITY_DN22196_c0_g1~~TRINITY_DN22196_c0_g1_i1.p1  ORF type:complete len:1475 (+),score=348.70 TRINITY_DN22196_c0_g1_i1:86-4426(+)